PPPPAGAGLLNTPRIGPLSPARVLERSSTRVVGATTPPRLRQERRLSESSEPDAFGFGTLADTRRDVGGRRGRGAERGAGSDAGRPGPAGDAGQGPQRHQRRRPAGQRLPAD